MLIYRWEDENKFGPYASEKITSIGKFFIEPHCASNGRPAWTDDYGMSLDLPYHKFGFNSREQESKWFFPHERFEMLCAGLKLQMYEIEDSKILIAKHQVVFSWLDADAVEINCPFRKTRN